MAERNYYVISDNACKFPSMTKEQIYALLDETIASGHLPTDYQSGGFVTQIKEKNRKTDLSFWVGTQAQYNAIAKPDENTFYIISDDDSLNDIETKIQNLTNRITAIENNGKGVLLWDGDFDTWNNNGFITLPDDSPLFTEYETLYVVVGGSCKKITGATTTTASQFTENGVYLTRRISKQTETMWTGNSGECYGWDKSNADLRSGTLSNLYVTLKAFGTNGTTVECINAIAQNMPLNHVSGSAAEIYAGLHIYRIYGVLKSEAAG